VPTWEANVACQIEELSIFCSDSKSYKREVWDFCCAIWQSSHAFPEAATQEGEEALGSVSGGETPDVKKSKSHASFRPNQGKLSRFLAPPTVVVKTGNHMLWICGHHPAMLGPWATCHRGFLTSMAGIPENSDRLRGWKKWSSDENFLLILCCVLRCHMSCMS